MTRAVKEGRQSKLTLVVLKERILRSVACRVRQKVDRKAKAHEVWSSAFAVSRGGR